MSTPDYPTFSKRIQRSQRNYRGAYNFDRSAELKLAEKWFQERREQRASMLQPQTTMPSSRLPPGLPIPTSVPKKCKKCSVPQNNPVLMSCCQANFCFKCALHQADLFNRCFNCNKIINFSKYEEYDGLDLKIPSYDDFDYKDPDEITLPVVKLQETYSTPLLDDSNNQTNTDSLVLNMNMDVINFQLNFQYIMFMAMFSQLLKMEEG